MKHKHTILMVLLGWLLAAFVPPTMLLSKVSGKAA
jgi:hypothetical protein